MRLEGHCPVCKRRIVLIMLGPGPDGNDGRCPFCGVRVSDKPGELAEAVLGVESSVHAFVRAARMLIGMDPGFSVAFDWDPAAVGQPDATPALTGVGMPHAQTSAPHDPLATGEERDLDLPGMVA